MKTVINTNDTKISVTAEYNSEFIARARTLSGVWEKPSWVFDIREEKAVRMACLECYGTDGFLVDLVDVEITIPEYVIGMGSCKPIELFGRTIARAFGRDSGAKLGEGIVLVAGGFTSGGSMKNWATDVMDGTVVIMRDVSRALADNHIGGDFIVRILDAAPTVNKGALESEKKRLLTRLAEIDELLGEDSNDA